MKASIKIFGVLVLFITVSNCNKSRDEKSTNLKQKPVKNSIVAPAFDAQLSFEKIKTQLEFGVRVPNTPGHIACGDWIVSLLKSFELSVIEQTFDSYSYKGEKLKARNIIASFNPSATKRILLAAHWDTRAIADQDDQKINEAIPGANDGASGVAVLLQIAETIFASDKKPAIGIDYIFFDVEDGGAPSSYTGNSLNDYGGYLMGSEYWAKNPHIKNYSAFYGILLDMVGAKSATFYKDKISMQVAPSIVNKVWSIASRKGYSTFFLSEKGTDLIDDHLPVIRYRKIPMIDIIDQKKNGSQTFFDHWHTHRDDLSGIDVNTLKAIGETVLQTLYEENGAQ